MRDFWEAAFGGKDTLRLSLGAYNPRTRKNKTSVTYSFNYEDGKSIRIHHYTEMLLECYFITHTNRENSGIEKIVLGVSKLKRAIEK